MRKSSTKRIVPFAATLCVLMAAVQAEAVTEIFNREVEMNDAGNGATPPENRPFFTIGGPDGYVGTAISGGTSSSSDVTNPNVGLGGNQIYNDVGNGVPLGVGLNFGVSFTVSTTNPNHFLVDNGNPGLGVNSSATQVDSNPLELSAGEQLLFSNIQLTNVSIFDPLGLLQPGATIGNPRWKTLRSGSFAAPTDFASTSSDAAVNFDVTMFDDVTNKIENNYTAPNGTFSPLSSVYVTTTGGNWPLKGIRYEVAFDYELAPVPATRRTFQFGEVQPGTYEGQPSHVLLDTGGNGDTNITISAVGATGALLDTNSLGVGVNSSEDDAATTNQQRFINGTLATPEALQFSFDRDVSLESLTLGNLDFAGTEGVVLSVVSGNNPFAGGLTGYSSDYTVGANSITFTPSAANQTPYLIPYGIGGQQDIIIEAGTVMSLTSNPAFDQGFLLDMITVHLLEEPGQDGDHNGDGVVDAADYVAWRKLNIDGEAGYSAFVENFGEPAAGGSNAVPEPGTWALVLLALFAFVPSLRRKA
jgi:hypothetical protein